MGPNPATVLDRPAPPPAIPGRRPTATTRLLARPAAKLAIGALVLVSLAWTVLSGAAVAALRDEAGQLGVFAVLLAITGTCFAVGGAGLLVVTAGSVSDRTAAAGRSPIGRARLLWRSLPDVALDTCRHRWFMPAWILNSVGTLAPCIVLVAAVIVLLPPASWGLALVPALDFVVSASVRAPIHVAAVRRRRDGVG